MTANSHRRLAIALTALALAALAIAELAAWQVVERNAIFDDALISYRYARHLSQGEGLVWNRGEAPVEGYTNFLLVAALAPAIRAGLDPLWTTRAWSLAAALLLAALIGREAIRPPPGSRAVGLASAAGFLLMSRTAPIATVGLETLIFTALLFATFVLGNETLERPTPRLGAATALLGFAACLTRPEALLLVALLGVELIGRRRRRLEGAASTLTAALLAFAAPLGAYLTWKLLYFGAVVPNAYRVKAGASPGISELGLASILGYAHSHRILLILVSLSLLTPLRRRWNGRRVAFALCVLWTLFYLRVDTLMDIYGRFLYPLTPFLFFLALPVVVRLLGWLVSLSGAGVRATVAAAAVLLLLFPLRPIENFRVIADALRGIDRAAARPATVARSEEPVARALSAYPEIRQVTIAWGNAGVIPWITDARFVDMVGLNDAFLAGNRDLPAMVDYFFARRADLVIVPTDSQGDWFGGHSYLGSRLTEWDDDRRWDDYHYIGTLRTARARDHHYWVRSRSPHAAPLTTLLTGGSQRLLQAGAPPALGLPARDRQP